MRRRRVPQSHPQEPEVVPSQPEVQAPKDGHKGRFICLVVVIVILLAVSIVAAADVGYLMHHERGIPGISVSKQQNIWRPVVSDIQSSVHCDPGERLDLPSGQYEAGAHAYTLHSDSAMPRGSAATENYCAHLRAIIHSYERCGRVNDTRNLLDWVELLDPQCANASVWHYSLNTYVLNCDAEGVKYVNVTNVADSELFWTCARGSGVPVVVALDDKWRGVWCAELEVAINAVYKDVNATDCPSIGEVHRAFYSFESSFETCSGGNYTGWESWMDSYHYNACGDFDIGLNGFDSHEYRRQAP